jgi:uncharacterized membrane protein
MMIMALDHTREFWGPTEFRPEDIDGTSVPLFFTRWITHICAPTFVFLSGASIFLYHEVKKDLIKTATFTFSRGVWLIAVELIAMTFILTHGYDLIVLSILWVIGCCMVIMSALIWIPRKMLLILSLVIIVMHNLWPPFQASTPGEFVLAAIHNTPFFIPQYNVLVTYTIIPWIGIMAAGYCAGALFLKEEKMRGRVFRWSGIALLVLFVIVRLINGYGDLSPFVVHQRGFIFTVLSFLNVTKYPPSLLFISVTLGISFILISVLDGAGRIGRFMSVYGRVPFFFFVLHFCLISLGSYLWTKISFGEAVNLAFTPFDQLPESYYESLPRVYVVWIVVLIVTYFPCRWFSDYKKRHRWWWLSYL